MSVQVLLDRLQKVKRVGANRWMAACPTHEDRRPSLSVRELGDGRILLYDFGGCDVGAVLSALDLPLAALFPAPLPNGSPTRERPAFPSDVFEMICFEASVVWLIGFDLHKNKKISEADYERLCMAVGKLERIKDAAYGSR